MIPHPERLAYSGRLTAPEPRARLGIHHRVGFVMLLIGTLHVAERTIHTFEIPAEFLWAARVIIWKEL